jgi:hypothetical protein
MEAVLALAAFAGMVYMAAGDHEEPAPKKKRKKKKTTAKKSPLITPPSVLSAPPSPVSELQASGPEPASPVLRSESPELVDLASLTPVPTL